MKACLTSSILCAATLVACVAPEKNIGLESETSEVTQSGGSEDPSGGETDDPSATSGVPGECGGIGDEATCDATVDCAWVNLQRIEGSGDFCGFEDVRGECIETVYQGEGCGVPPTCGEDGEFPSWWRSLGGDAYDIIVPSADFLCENRPVDFTYCMWDDAGNPIDSPEACQCQCLGGGGESLPPGVESDLGNHAGCSDVFAYAYNDAGTIALTFYVDAGYAMQATETMTPVDVELAAQDVELKLYVGTDLQNAFCTDVGGLGEPDASWTATAGDVALHIELVDDQPHASLVLTNLVFDGDGPDLDPYEIASFEINDVLVGWFPG